MRNRMTLNPRRVYVRVDILILAFFNICFVGLILVGMTGFWQELGPRSW